MGRKTFEGSTRKERLDLTTRNELNKSFPRCGNNSNVKIEARPHHTPEIGPSLRQPSIRYQEMTSMSGALECAHD